MPGILYMAIFARQLLRQVQVIFWLVYLGRAGCTRNELFNKT
jgi:hypothetical protein